MSQNQGVLEAFRGGLVVSCQAPPGSPMRHHQVMASVAAAAVAGGAVGIRANGPEDIAAIRDRVEVPIIGLLKQFDPEGGLWITPDLEAATRVVEGGADIVAVDATLRSPRLGPDAATLVATIRSELGVPVLADVDTVAAGVAAVEAGADAVATTLAGYTKERPIADGKPDVALLAELTRQLDSPVIAEGRYRSPTDVTDAFAAGAFAVVIGTAITDPLRITQEFVAAVDGSRKPSGDNYG